MTMPMLEEAAQPAAGQRLPTFEDVRAARRRLDGKAAVTPLLESTLLNDRLGGRLLVKAETLQLTGSFKFRGAYSRMSLIPPADRQRGVVAFSSGNHAQGVAAAARALGMTATIVMPADAPSIKLRNTQAWGAKVVLYHRDRESREEIGARIAAETGATLIPPYDDPAIIAGQGTAGMELVEQAAALGVRLDAVAAPCGGGGLIAGVGLAVRSLAPTTEIYAIEPAGFDDTGRSLAAGRRLGNEPDARSICDALLAPMPGALTFALNAAQLSGARAVNDTEVRLAMAVAFEHLKLVVEPGGAVALASVLAGQLDVKGRAVAIVCSGGNVEPSLFAEALATPGT